ncbi:MAG: GNAT family N-acetyltransferase [Candidatus Thiodiazotropha sp.]
MMQIDFHTSIDAIDAPEWNCLVSDDNPFLRHEFLAALEHHGCVGERFGWLPTHLSVRQSGRLIGVSPLYFKHNSYGEFVFDHAWADAYRQNGLAYFPKLVSAIPYTPATGSRLLIAPDVDAQAVREQMIASVRALTSRSGASSLHWLFPPLEEAEAFTSAGLSERLGVQFHWHNPGYADFEQFLAELTTKRRKNIRQERRKVKDAGLRLRRIPGNEVTPEEWRLFERFYRKTFEERYSLPTLNLGFFQEIGQTLGRQVVLVLAYEGAHCIAGALLYRSRDVLYGRHWGGISHHDSLHFEACYYQGIEYAIAEGLRVFEPGAQGEHKIWRGFLPTLTRSYHWIEHPGFRQGIDNFLSQETPAVLDYYRTLHSSNPFKNT